MQKKFKLIIAIMVPLLASVAWPFTRFGETLCKSLEYYCIKIKKGQNWNSLFPKAEIKDIVKRINRMNINLSEGMILAIPKNIERLTIYDLSPFPRYIVSTGEKTIYINQEKLAWGAYDAQGELVWWGPISSGMDQCKGVNGGCKTPTGSYRIFSKQNIDCMSNSFPQNTEGGGALMPYCMHFYRGFALHGSSVVPGYRASHGCVRMFTEDARWLNEEFAESLESNQKGTRVIVDSIP